MNLKFFYSGVVCQFLNGIGHLIGQSLGVEAVEPKEKLMVEMMRTLDLGGITMWKLYEGFGIWFSISMFFFGILNWFVIRNMEKQEARITLAWLNAAMMMVLVVMCALFFVPPPLILSAIGGLCFIASAFNFKKAV